MVARERWVVMACLLVGDGDACGRVRKAVGIAVGLHCILLAAAFWREVSALRCRNTRCEYRM